MVPGLFQLHGATLLNRHKGTDANNAFTALRVTSYGVIWLYAAFAINWSSFHVITCFHVLLYACAGH